MQREIRIPEPGAPLRAAGAARDISLQLTAGQKTPVEVRLVERAGEVRVAVRSNDPQLTETLRSGLSELTERLAQRGFASEIWRPESPRQSEPDHHGGRESQPQQDRESRRERHPQDGRQPEWMEEFGESLSSTAIQRKAH